MLSLLISYYLGTFSISIVNKFGKFMSCVVQNFVHTAVFLIVNCETQKFVV